MVLDSVVLNAIVSRALMEDIGTGDITTQGIVPKGFVNSGFIKAKEPGVIAGMDIVRAVFLYLCPEISYQPFVVDGQRVTSGQLLAKVEGDAGALLSGERVALNFLQRMSGIATRTAFLVSLIAGYKAKLVDTRKTTPGMRVLEKYSVRVGGGRNHRFGLYDAILIKDNHIKVAGSITEAIARSRTIAPHLMKIEVEVENLAGVQEAICAGADVIMLDNMSLQEMKEAVDLTAGKLLTEASGGVNEKTIKAVAGTGVDYISIGSITHSFNSLDISMDIGEIKP